MNNLKLTETEQRINIVNTAIPKKRVFFHYNYSSVPIYARGVGRNGKGYKNLHNRQAEKRKNNSIAYKNSPQYDRLKRLIRGDIGIKYRDMHNIKDTITLIKKPKRDTFRDIAVLPSKEVLSQYGIKGDDIEL